ncbi:flagellar P-ring protein 1 [Agaricicola taiwanensis]|uniref:Flagellar P-ring protein n=1 Tax=Agaricicola taiwanensis TaxID=591372 RepID=A0A8J2VSU6_9RHOB|nr:flagellar basal body P-ring protein FlgI [Agaricicola taiwanensis]GGE40556.1 flagellar P-ring protein 1 [Agaricicola taiwanensis]
MRFAYHKIIVVIANIALATASVPALADGPSENYRGPGASAPSQPPLGGPKPPTYGGREETLAGLTPGSAPFIAKLESPYAPFGGGNPGVEASRIKDLIDVEGVRENQLIGYGLVVGLNGTGDSLNASPFTRQSLTSMLERLGVNTRGATLRTKNVAAVMVTANLPPFATQGTRIDVTVSALGDATSLQGGSLLVTPLMGANGEVYSVAQGPVAVIGFNAEGSAATIVRGVPTAGRISNGGLVEREIDFSLGRMTSVRLSLRNPDFTTARRMAAAINDYVGSGAAEPVDPGTLQLTLPPKYEGNIIQLLTEIEQLRVVPDIPAKIVIDERSGIIVMGRDVRVSTVAVAQGNLTVTISEQPQVSQPEPFSDGTTVVVPNTTITVQEDARQLAVVKQGITLQQLVDGLNSLGISPRDLIGILQAIKAAGALQAEIEVM